MTRSGLIAAVAAMCIAGGCAGAPEPLATPDPAGFPAVEDSALIVGEWRFSAEEIDAVWGEERSEKALRMLARLAISYYAALRVGRGMTESKLSELTAHWSKPHPTIQKAAEARGLRNGAAFRNQLLLVFARDAHWGPYYQRHPEAIGPIPPAGTYYDVGLEEDELPSARQRHEEYRRIAANVMQWVRVGPPSALKIIEADLARTPQLGD